MPLAPTVSSLARETMRTAFEDLERTVTPADSRTFRSTTIQHVQTAALELENQLAARQALCNMRRLEPLLDGLKHYSKVVDVLCNGTPFLPWIWAPIMLILKVASEYVGAFEQIMKGYSRIAEDLGRFHILSETFIADPTFQQTVAVFYADILQFHKHAYKFVRRGGWKLLFITSWGRYERRFENIFEDLRRHGKLIDQEANARNIAAASQMRQEIRAWREESLDQVRRDEERQATKESLSILSWLKFDETEQIQILETVSEEGTKFPGTCSWLLKNDKIKSWLQKKPDPPLLWLQGNPGCGKSVIAAKLVDFLHISKLPIVHHFCTYTYASSTKYDGILRSILQQLMRQSDELVAHVYHECIVGKKPPTTCNLERLIETLVIALSDEPRETQYTWIIIDGINECEAAKQTRLINVISQISSISSSAGGAVCKVLVTTRPSPTVSKYFRKNLVIFLSDESSPLQSAIRMYVSQRLRSLHDRFRQMELETEQIEEIETLVSRKAGGMFLYARLVLDYISANLFFDEYELKEAINQLPETLAEFYQKLLALILARLNEQSQDRVRCIFSWVAFAKRPLKKLEFLSALSFTSGNPELTKLVPRYIVEDICSPLIEERRDTSFAFIYVSVKHFLQSTSSTVMLKEKDSLHEHGIAAVSCLLSGLQVFHKKDNEQTRLLRLIKGVHGFHVYATEYWTEYLLANAATSGGIESSPRLLDLATRLTNALDSMVITPPSEKKIPPGSVDIRLKLLDGHKTIQKHVEKALLAGSQKHLESELLRQSHTNPAGHILVQTCIEGTSIILKAYQKALESLLDLDSCAGASVEELEFFKSQFRTSAYTCRLRSCPRATIGFQSDHLRHEHEIGHTGGFRCTFLGCQYPPFQSSKALASHTNSNHLHTATLPRKSIRKVGHLGGRSLSARNDKKAGSESTILIDRAKDLPSTISPLKASSIQWPNASSANKKRSRSPSLSTRKVTKSRISESACFECLRKNLLCSKALPACVACKLWSHVCIYPQPCEQCISKALHCDKSQPICKSCESSSVECSYGDTDHEHDIDHLAVAKRIPGDASKNNLTSTTSQGPFKESSTSETSFFDSDLFGSSGIGVGYLDILLEKLTGSNSIDPGLFKRFRAALTNNMNACLELAEFVDNLKEGSVNALSPGQIISHLWSTDLTVAKELQLLVGGGVGSERSHGMKEVGEKTDDGEDSDSSDESTLNQPLDYCICNKEDSGNMIECDNSACSRKWFHLYCVNLVITPDEHEKWFCSGDCRKANTLV